MYDLIRNDDGLAVAAREVSGISLPTEVGLYYVERGMLTWRAGAMLDISGEAPFMKAVLWRIGTDIVEQNLDDYRFRSMGFTRIKKIGSAYDPDNEESLTR